MYRENALKKRLYAGKKALGCWLVTSNAMCAEVLGLAGYDFVMIDHEHGPGDLASAIGVLQALSACGTTALMRVPWNDPVYIKRALDTGVEGVMVPMVETAEQARAAVAACRYPPDGIRGAATGLIRAADYGLAEKEYIKTINDNLLIICQIESIRGIDNVGPIAEVEGVDILFVGPSDISANMGYPGQRDRPEVKEMLARVERLIKDAGKLMGTVLREGHGFQDLFELGYDMVSGGSDMVHIRNAAKAQVAAHREANG